MSIKADNPLTVLRWAKITASLADAPMHMHDLSRVIHAHSDTTRRHVNLMRAHGLLHICKWVAYGAHGFPIAVYAVGARKDAKKPAPKTPAQKNAKWWKGVKKDEDRHEARLQHRRARNHARIAARTPKTWLSALGVAI